MSPQGWFHSFTQLPKLVITQALTCFSAHTTIQSTPTLFYLACTTQDNGPPSLPCSPSGYPPPSRAPVHLAKNIHVGTLRIHSCGKQLTHANAFRHACINSWMEYTRLHYFQPNHGSSPKFLSLSQPRSK
jgi:hypothetical protein